MERESMVFYRSFYKAIVDQTKEIQLEVVMAILEYGLNGTAPENLRPIAKGFFVLMQPVIDANMKRYENGKKGGRKPTRKDVATVEPLSERKPPEKRSFTSFEEEVKELKEREQWKESVCMQFHIEPSQLDARLDEFALHCKTSRGDDFHSSPHEVMRHFTSWLRIVGGKSTTTNSDTPPKPDDYTYNGGFGGMDV